MRLGKVVRRYRLMDERALREVGKEIGIAAATLMRLEMGHAPDGKTLAKVLSWLFAEDRPARCLRARRGMIR